MSVVHPIARAWISTGGTGARNYDEFADDAEITEIVSANPASALAIEMPHRAPDSLGRTFTAALPDAVDRLRRQREDGSYVPAQDVVLLYRIGELDRPDEAAYGLVGMVDTDQISTSADEPGLVIRNEDVFIDKVRERVALAEATGHLLSPVLLLQTGSGLHAALASAVADAGVPDVTDVDHVGRTHALWTVAGDSELGRRLMDLAGAGELVVADGNHRSLAAQVGELPRFLAVVTTPGSVAIQPYHRLVTELPISLRAVLDGLRVAGAEVGPVPADVLFPAEAASGRVGIPPQGTIILYGQEGAHRVTLPAGPSESIVDGMDHALVERVLMRDVLGLDPGDKRIVYVGGDYPPSWLAAEVDSGRAEAAVLIAPVRVDEFVAVNLARQKMPRKSTWFTPKARGGLVLAELAAEG